MSVPMPMRPDEFIDGLWTGWNRWAAYSLWYALEEDVIDGWRERRDAAYQEQAQTGRRDLWQNLIDDWAIILGVNTDAVDKWWGIVPYVLGAVEVHLAFGLAPA